MPSHISFRLFILLPTCAIRESREADEIDQTDLRKDFRDMRIRSYHGFIILLGMMNVAGYLQNLNVTFLMPDDGNISQLPTNQRNLQDFVLSHTIPAMLKMDDQLHSPNGTLVPTSLPKRMISISRWQFRPVPEQCQDCNSKCLSKIFYKVSWNRLHNYLRYSKFFNIATRAESANYGIEEPGMTKNRAADNRTAQWMGVDQHH